MLHFCTVNKRIMEARRKNEVYVTLLIDLVNLNVVTKEQAKALLGYSLPDHVLDKSSASSGNSDDDSGNDDSSKTGD